MRLTSVSKILLLCVVSLACISIFHNYKNIHKQWRILKVFSDKPANNEHFKYILQWTHPKNIPFLYMAEGQQGFLNWKCPYSNCIVTNDRDLLGNYTKFDVIAFAGPEVVQMPMAMLPQYRSPHQKYVFASIESPANYPLCSNRFDNYFNWTWTYKLDSEVRWGYLVIRDSENKVIGPNKEMDWIEFEDMSPVSDVFKNSLKSKTKAVAWFVSNCNSVNGREMYAWELQEELLKYKLALDIYGDCGIKRCPRSDEDKCNAMIAKDYYFYLSFENAFSEDYVTEKLLTAVQHNAVPIVYGGANYSRFLPDGSYLNANEMDVKNMALKIRNLIENFDEYADYFRWKNHYSYHKTLESVNTNEYCKFCEILNDEKMVTTTSVYKDFYEWWEGDADHC